VSALWVVGAVLAGVVSGALAHAAIDGWVHRRETLDHTVTLPRATTVVVMALAFGATMARWGPSLQVLILLVFVWVVVTAALIDLPHRIIPNDLTLSAPVVLVALIGILTWTTGDRYALVRGAFMALVMPLVMLLTSGLYRLLRGQAGIGGGDIKLAISLGLVLGHLGAMYVVVFLYATVAAALVVVVSLVLARRLSMASRIPFGPYLATGALVAVVGGEPLTRAVRGVVLGY